MKTLETIQTLAKIGKILSYIAFIFAYIGFGGSVVGALSAAFGGGFAIKLGGVTICLAARATASWRASARRSSGG